MKRKVGVTVAALILAAQLGSPLAAQQPSLEQLTEVAGLLAENDVEGLRAYIEANPELLDGDGPLAALFRRFLVESEDLATYLGLQPDLSEGVGALLGDVETPPEQGSDGGGEPIY